MTGIFFRHALALEHVAKVPLTIGAHNFHPFHAKRNIGVPDNGARDFIVERGPATATVKLVGRIVQGRIAATANEGAYRLEVVVFTCKGSFRSFLSNDIFFFGGQGVPILSVVFHVFYCEI